MYVFVKIFTGYLFLQPDTKGGNVYSQLGCCIIQRHESMLCHTRVAKEKIEQILLAFFQLIILCKNYAENINCYINEVIDNSNEQPATNDNRSSRLNLHKLFNKKKNKKQQPKIMAAKKQSHKIFFNKNCHNYGIGSIRGLMRGVHNILDQL